MKPLRLFVFAMAFLGAAFLLRQIVDGFSAEQQIHAADAARRADSSAGPQPVADTGSP